MVNMLMYIGALLLSAQVMQPSTPRTFCDLWSSDYGRVAKAEECEARTETEGRIVYETCEFSSGRKVSRLSHSDLPENLPVVLGYYSILSGSDLDGDGAFDIASAVYGHHAIFIFDPEGDAEASPDPPDVVSPWKIDYWAEKKKTSEHLNRLREIALESCK